MWNWFGGGSGAAANRKDSPKNAILGLRSQLEMLQKRERHLQSQIEEQNAAARKHVGSNNTNAAKAALRRKKAHERSLEQTEQQITTLEQQVYNIESANINRDTLAAVEQASKAMKKIHGKLTVESVENIMDGMREQQELSDDIVNALGQNANPIDEHELEEDLELLQQEQLDEAMLKTGTVPVLPSPATQEPVSNKKETEEEDEEAELRKLEAEMAIPQ
ncbi:ESCRT-III subunit protein snf7 [Lecanicillium sp. MT-2017a]|nr:ESCRT-III subunit protein snf7 [Lecanicillium sp. MT-2017a]